MKGLANASCRSILPGFLNLLWKLPLPLVSTAAVTFCLLLTPVGPMERLEEGILLAELGRLLAWLGALVEEGFMVSVCEKTWDQMQLLSLP